jgi:hypothetical protein
MNMNGRLGVASNRGTVRQAFSLPRLTELVELERTSRRGRGRQGG